MQAPHRVCLDADDLGIAEGSTFVQDGGRLDDMSCVQ